MDRRYICIRGKIIHHYRRSSNFNVFRLIIAWKALENASKIGEKDLTGIALDNFFMRESAVRWDNSEVEKLESNHIKRFSKKRKKVNNFQRLLGPMFGKREEIKVENWFKWFKLVRWWCTNLVEMFTVRPMGWDENEIDENYETFLLYCLNHDTLWLRLSKEIERIGSTPSVVGGLSYFILMLLLLCGL